MAFKIFFHPKAKKFVDKLDAETRERIKNKISELKLLPEEKGKKFKYSNFWSLRVGDFHAVYEIDKQNQKVIVLFVGHRKNVYPDFSKLL